MPQCVCYHMQNHKIAKRTDAQIIPKLHYFQSHTYLFFVFRVYDNVRPTQDKTKSYQSVFWDAHRLLDVLSFSTPPTKDKEKPSPHIANHLCVRRSLPAQARHNGNMEYNRVKRKQNNTRGKSEWYHHKQQQTK